METRHYQIDAFSKANCVLRSAEQETEGEEQAAAETTRSTIPSGTEVTRSGAASDLVFGAVASVAAAAALLI